MSSQPSNPNEEKVETPVVKDVKDDLSKFKAIAALTDQEGGKILLATLKEEIRYSVENIISLFKAPELELRCAIAKLKTDLSLYRVLKRSKDNVRLAEEELSKLLEID